MHIRVQLVNGEELEFQVGQSCVTLGRSSKCDVVIPHEGMSRQHCQIEVVDGEVFITDLGSTNGVLIDGQRIEPHKRTQYATFLSLAFGAVQSLQLSFDDVGSENESQNNPMSRDPSGTTHVKTAVIKELQRPQPKVKPAKEEKETSSSGSPLINVLALILLCAVVWWYLSQE